MELPEPLIETIALAVAAIVGWLLRGLKKGPKP